MPVIKLYTEIVAPIDRVFDLARSIDAHQDTAEQTSERAIAGRTSGLMDLGEEVTWEARHFGIKQRLQVKMTKYDRPNHFQDVMIKGAFRWMQHDHYFKESEGIIIMTDRFEYLSPLGLLGRLVDELFLERYMRNFIQKRNAILKRTAESTDWKNYIKNQEK